jgi:hypothetical protein
LIVYKKRKLIERKRCEKKREEKAKKLRLWAGLALDFPSLADDDFDWGRRGNIRTTSNCRPA